MSPSRRRPGFRTRGDFTSEREANSSTLIRPARPIIDAMGPGTTQVTMPRLLLVDDDPLISESLAFALADDYQVERAADRSAAVELLRAGSKPDLALIDLGLPPVPHLPNEGFKLIGDLLAHAPNVRILVLTGQNEESNARRARALGEIGRAHV